MNRPSPSPLRVLLLAVALLGACAQTTPAAPPRDILHDASPEDQASVKGVLDDIQKTVAKKDIDHLEAFHAYGPKFTSFSDWDPLERQDSAASKKGERDGLGALKSFTGSFDDLRIDVFGDVALATFHYRYAMETDDAKIATKARSTIVFVRDGATWKIVHEHHSAFKSNP